MSDQPLLGKIALVTGASRGIGRALALRLGKEGAELIVPAPSQPNADGVASEIAKLGKKALPLGGDVASPGAVERICAAALQVFQRVDILVNNAAMVHRAPLASVTDADFDRVLGVNLAG